MNIILFAIPFFIFLILFEALYSYKKGLNYYRLNDAVGNLSLGVTEQLVHLACLSWLIKIYEFGYLNLSIPIWPKGWLGWGLAFVAVDFQYYWFHRASHRINLIWASHIVHHQSEEYNLSVALRQGPVQGFFSFWFYLPLAFLGMPPEYFVSCFSINLLYQFWFHTRVVKELPKAVELIMNTPAHHRVHHGRNPKYLDKNYAGVFIVWDRLFGSFKKEEDEPVYGTTKLLRSFDPVKATVDYFYTLANQSFAAKGFKNSILVWLKEPGWLPNHMGGFQKPPEVSRSETVEPFDPKLPTDLDLKLTVAFIVVTLLSVIVLAKGHDLGVGLLWFFTISLIASLSYIGQKYDGR